MTNIEQALKNIYCIYGYFGISIIISLIGLIIALILRKPFTALFIFVILIVIGVFLDYITNFKFRKEPCLSGFKFKKRSIFDKLFG